MERLTEEQERKLGECAMAGDNRAIDALITANIGFVVSIAKQYAGKGLPLNDLISEGNIAMMLAARKWNPGKGVRFVQYAVWDIRKAMERAIEQQVSVVRKPLTDDTSMSQLSMDAPLRKGYTRTLGETMPTRGQRSQVEEADLVDDRLDLQERIKLLSQRESTIINLYYGLGGEQYTMAEIGEKMGLKRERVRQIRKKAERKLRKSQPAS